MWHLRYLIKTFQHNSPRATQQGKGQKHSDLRKYLRSAEKVWCKINWQEPSKWCMDGISSGILGGRKYISRKCIFSHSVISVSVKYRRNKNKIIQLHDFHFPTKSNAHWHQCKEMHSNLKWIKKCTFLYSFKFSPQKNSKKKVLGVKCEGLPLWWGRYQPENWAN